MIALLEMIEIVVMVEAIDKNETSAEQQRRPVIPGIRIRIGRNRLEHGIAVGTLNELSCSVGLQTRAADSLLRLPIDYRLPLDRAAATRRRRERDVRCLSKDRG